ncbi:MAG: hypothetical protein AB1649_22885 [Chloroflexota bacterium]
MTEPFETQIQELANKFPYPPTPRVNVKVMAKLRARAAPRLRSRRLAWGLAILLALFAGLMAVPPVRAAVLEFIQIGIVRIFQPAPAPTEQIAPTPTAMPGPLFPVTATPAPTESSLIPALRPIAGETTLEDARQEVSFPISLPTYPADLGEPDVVFLQEVDRQMVVLIWLDPAKQDRVLTSLHIIQSGSWLIDKFEPTVVEETTVNGQRAVWTIGPYPLIMSDGDIDLTRLIDGRVLIWAEGALTYRLETDLSLEEAIRIAESLTSP